MDGNISVIKWRKGSQICSEMERLINLLIKINDIILVIVTEL